jgi:hypothetical protein
MHASKDSMWREMWKILQNSWGTKLGLYCTEKPKLIDKAKIVVLLAPVYF